MSGEQAADSGTQTPDVGAAPTSLVDTAAPAAETPAEQPASDAAYEFQAREGMSLDEVATGEWGAVAKELGLDQASAQKAVDIAAGMLQRQQEAQSNLVASWVEQAQTDKEFGGDKLQESLGGARKVLDTFGTPELRDVLNATGMGNHPELIRALYRINKAISEDTFVTGAPRGRETDMAKRMFPGMN